MSGRPLDITQRQVKALCKGAKEAGYAPVVRIGNTVVWLIPEERAVPGEVKAKVDAEEDFRL